MLYELIAGDVCDFIVGTMRELVCPRAGEEGPQQCRALRGTIRKLLVQKGAGKKGIACRRTRCYQKSKALGNGRGGCGMCFIAKRNDQAGGCVGWQQCRWLL